MKKLFLCNIAIYFLLTKFLIFQGQVLYDIRFIFLLTIFKLIYDYFWINNIIYSIIQFKIYKSIMKQNYEDKLKRKKYFKTSIIVNFILIIIFLLIYLNNSIEVLDIVN